MRQKIDTNFWLEYLKENRLHWRPCYRPEDEFTIKRNRVAKCATVSRGSEMGQVADSCTGKWTLWFHKKQGMSWLATQMLTCQKLCFMKFTSQLQDGCYLTDLGTDGRIIRKWIPRESVWSVLTRLRIPSNDRPLVHIVLNFWVLQKQRISWMADIKFLFK